MKTNKERIHELLRLLHRKLTLEYPYYHWHHPDIFSTYWKLHDEVLYKKEGKAQ